MSAMDPWSADGFTLVELTESLKHLPAKPMRIDQMALFEPAPGRLASIMIEEQGGVLTLVPYTARGGPATQHSTGKRTIRPLTIPSLKLEDTILAEEVQGIREFGTIDAEQSLATVVNNRMQEMKDAIDVTMEHKRAGALSGVIYDANGTDTLYNLFTEFNVTQTSVDFILGTDGTEQITKCQDVLDAIETVLGAGSYTGVHCLCGRTFFNRFTTHPKIITAFNRYREGAFFREDKRKGFEFGGIFFEVYRATVNSIDYIADTEARFFPIGVPRLYKNAMAPADFEDTVNTMAMPMYAKQVPADNLGRGRLLHVQANQLPFCTRPGVLIRGHSSD